jgi:hypothetical protein
MRGGSELGKYIRNTERLDAKRSRFLVGYVHEWVVFGLSSLPRHAVSPGTKPYTPKYRPELCPFSHVLLVRRRTAQAARQSTCLVGIRHATTTKSGSDAARHPLAYGAPKAA